MEKCILSGDLIDEARRRRGLDWKKLARKAGVSPSWLDGARRGKVVTEAFAEKLAMALDVSADDLGKRKPVFHSYEELYPLVGLWAEEAKEYDDDIAVQDWSMRKGDKPNNPLAYLWAAAAGSRISACVPPEDDDPVLRVEFENRGSPHPCNVAIHPTGMYARKTKSTQRYLTFEFRAVEEGSEDATEEGPSPQPPVSVVVRVRDANLVQWVYGNPSNGSYSVAILNEEPSTFGIDLKPDTGQRKWMTLYGERRAADEPDFNVIATVVFEVGRGFPGDRPGQGKGVVEIGKLFLREELPDDVKLLG